MKWCETQWSSSGSESYHVRDKQDLNHHLHSYQQQGQRQDLAKALNWLRWLSNKDVLDVDGVPLNVRELARYALSRVDQDEVDEVCVAAWRLHKVTSGFDS